MNNKKIIGYKLLKDLPDVKRGSKFTEEERGSYIFTTDSNGAYRFTITEITKNTDWFEPVYEPEEITLTLGHKDMNIVIGKNKIFADGKLWDFDELRNLSEMFYDRKINKTYELSFSLNDRFIKIGCCTFSISEISRIVDSYKELNGIK